jgi:hypothetical protein
MEGRERRGWHTRVPACRYHWPPPPCLCFAQPCSSHWEERKGEENTGWVRERGGGLGEEREREGGRVWAGEGEKGGMRGTERKKRGEEAVMGERGEEEKDREREGEGLPRAGWHCVVGVMKYSCVHLNGLICRYPEGQVPPHTSSRSGQKARHANHTHLSVVNLSMNHVAQASSGTATCPVNPAPAA